MSANSKIQWCDATLNVFRGCLKVSEGCKNCYAITTAHQLNTRFKGAQSVAARKVAAKYEGLTKVLSNSEKNWTGEVQVDYDTMMRPFKWKKGKRIFVNSMSDVFYEKISVADIAILFAVMFLTPQHTYMILTKRPERMQNLLGNMLFKLQVYHLIKMIPQHLINGQLIKNKVIKNFRDLFFFLKCNILSFDILAKEGLNLERDSDFNFPFKNIWLGVSVENQATANERIPLLLSTPAHIRFLSMEPLLDAVYLNRLQYNGVEFSCLYPPPQNTNMFKFLNVFQDKVDWVIVGGESGSKARPMNPRWVEHIKNCCEGANVPFFFKQWGEYVPVENSVHDEPFFINEKGYGVPMDFEVIPKNKIHQFELSNNYVYKIGKHKAGRLLNGKEYNEFPKTDN